MSVADARSRGSRAAGQDDGLDGQFETIRALLHDVAGISLNDSKKPLVRSRVGRRMRATGHSSFADYMELVLRREGRDELVRMIDALTTNETSFFREARHFDLLRDVLAERSPSAAGPTLWSAGCSTGQEPYTLALLVAEQARGRGSPGRILATDISGRALDAAQKGVYSADDVEPVPRQLRERYLRRVPDSDGWEVGPELRGIVRFAALNLVGEWPMTGPFDVIFCRNVMIYFDGPTKERLVRRLGALLAPGGHLFVGHSESLSAMAHGLDYVQPAVYRRGGAG